MNRWTRRICDLLDAERIRFGVALLIGIVAWACVLTLIVNRLAQRAQSLAIQEQPIVQMQLVEIAPPATPVQPTPARTWTAARPAPARPEPTSVRAIQPHVAQRPAMDSSTVNAESSPMPTSTTAQATPSATTLPATSPPSSAAADKPAPLTSAAAQLISQPMPVLSDDLREDAYQAVAIARFDIHADGTVDVVLSKPTPNPRLNALLLEALRKWRFFPAMQAGRAVESHQEVRVHFNVS